MKKFVVEFKDDTDKLILILVLLGSFFAFCLPAFIAVLFLKKYLSDGTYNVCKAFFNFELLRLLVTLAFAIPVIGWILGSIFGIVVVIFNIVIIAMDLVALAQKKELIVPVLFEFL